MNQHRYLDNDWYGGGIPANVTLGHDVYVDTSHAFANFLSQRDPGATLGDCCGIYDRAALVVGPGGFVTVGAYSCLNGTYLICHERIEIGANCLLSWGVVISDANPSPVMPASKRHEPLRAAADHADRYLRPAGQTRPVTIGDNVWIGFDSVVLPGVTIGRGSIVGCKTIVHHDVPPYSVVVGSPARIVRTMEADDTEQVRLAILQEYTRGT